MYVRKKLYYTNSSLAAIQLRFAPQNYTVTEGGAVNITLEAMSFIGGYEFYFTVTLQYMNGSATGECVQVHVCKYIRTYLPVIVHLFEHATVAYLPFVHMTAGYDYTPSPYTVTFTAGQMYATLMVSTTDDNTTELSEYFRVAITSTDQPSVVEIASPNMAFITIEDNDPGMLQPSSHSDDCSVHACLNLYDTYIRTNTHGKSPTCDNAVNVLVIHHLQLSKCHLFSRTTPSLRVIQLSSLCT